jgi:hypothetical protein
MRESVKETFGLFRVVLGLLAFHVAHPGHSTSKIDNMLTTAFYNYLKIKQVCLEREGKRAFARMGRRALG